MHELCCNFIALVAGGLFWLVYSGLQAFSCEIGVYNCQRMMRLPQSPDKLFVYHLKFPILASCPILEQRNCQSTPAATFVSRLIGICQRFARNVNQSWAKWYFWLIISALFFPDRKILLTLIVYNCPKFDTDVYIFNLRLSCKVNMEMAEISRRRFRRTCMNPHNRRVV